MKMNELLEKAKEEIKTEEEKKALALIKESLLEISSARRTLKKLEKAHEKLLETDIEDLELKDYVY